MSSFSYAVEICYPRFSLEVVFYVLLPFLSTGCAFQARNEPNIMAIILAIITVKIVDSRVLDHQVTLAVTCCRWPTEEVIQTVS